MAYSAECLFIQVTEHWLQYEYLTQRCDNSENLSLAAKNAHPISSVQHVSGRRSTSAFNPFGQLTALTEFIIPNIIVNDDDHNLESVPVNKRDSPSFLAG